MSGSALKFTPLSTYVGARVEGLDLTQPIAAQEAAALRAAFSRYNMLLLHQPGISVEDQARFAELFGEILIRGQYKVASESPLTQHVSNTRADGILGDGEIDFHQDHVFYERPLKGLLLYGVEIPKSGGETKFRSARGIFEAMPQDLIDRAARVKCLHLYSYTGDYTRRQDAASAPPESPRAWHPLIWTNPDTGQKALWINRLTTVDFDGVSRDEGEALLEELERRANATTAYTYVHAWTPGDLVIWDNRMLHHARTPFDPAERRTLRRTPLV